MKYRYHHILIWFVLAVFTAVLLASPELAGSQSADNRTKEVDRLFSAWDRLDSPGCALGVIQNGRLIYSRGYGMANLEYGIPLSSQSVFRIGSTSKQFTAMCILLLEEEGKLTVDDTLKKYFPEMPGYAEFITIRHLIHHTSGIRDYLTLMELVGAREDDYYTDAEVVDLLVRQKELNFEPGREHLYSNSGYFLLSQIVKKVTGQSMNIFAEEKIFKPLGMTSTHFHDDHNRIVKDRAAGYGRDRETGFRINMTTLDMIGDGGIFTCIEDLLLWDRNFYENKLGRGGPELIEKMQTPGILNSGEKIGYAFGLGISEYKGLPMVSHAGGFVGFRAEMIRFPEQNFSVVVLANLGSINPSRLARQVADIYQAEALNVEEKRGEATPKQEVITLSPEELEAKTGDFYDESRESFLKIVLREGRLFVHTRRLGFFIQPLSRTRFVTVDAPVDLLFEFEQRENGRPKVVRIQQEEELFIYKSVQLERLDLEQMKIFAGGYYSNELDVTYRIQLKEDHLYLQHENPHRPNPGGRLVPKFRDIFTVQGLRLKFDRGAGGGIASFTVDAGRVKNIRFVKE